MCDPRRLGRSKNLIWRWVWTAAAALVLPGCHTPKHSNVLVFATSTKAGIDISYDPKVQEPNFVVGYKRQEGVWMPLLANLGEDGLTPGAGVPARAAPCATLASGRPIAAVSNTNSGAPRADSAGVEPASGVLFVGTEKDQVDTYSVLASFGAKFSGRSGRGRGAEGSGGLAQYFATGLAARKLAQVGGERLVSIQPSEAAAAEAAYAALTDDQLLSKQAELDELLKKPLKPGVEFENRTFRPDETRELADAFAATQGATLKTVRRRGGRGLEGLIDLLRRATEN